MLLAPGERAELLVNLSDGQTVALRTGVDPTLASGMMGFMSRLLGMSRTHEPLVGDTHVLRLEPDRSLESSAKTIPTQLAGAAGADASKATRRRVLTLTMGHGMMGRGGMGRGMMGGPSRPGMAGLPAQVFGIDGRPFELDRVDHTVRLGDTEIWEVSGEMIPHPFHIHGAHFTVLSRDGRAPAATDQGLKDTVLVQERVELLIRFTQPGVRVPFVFHCHTLEHEDAGMMGQYRTA
jgi:FtsP/CotA-like multicopper oxidase with cupredoxin domain